MTLYKVQNKKMINDTEDNVVLLLISKYLHDLQLKEIYIRMNL